MAGRSMFESCLSADILASLRGSVGSSNDDAAGYNLARVSIKVDSRYRDKDEYWISGDHLSGCLAVESVQPITITWARISLEGVSRIHTKAYDGDSQARTASSKLFAYKFLSQVHQLDPGDFVNTSTDGCGTTAASAPFAFSISYSALTKSPDVPQQCLQLPPSMTVGAVVQDENSGLRYAQPRISYTLVADIEIQSGSGDRMMISASEEIPIWSVSAPGPPIDTRDFPAEFVEILYHPCRPNRLRKETFLVKVSSSEPPPIKLVDRKTPGFATCKVSLTLADTRSGSDVNRLLEVSSRIRVSIIPALRIKTFYSISPFSKAPGQTMLTMAGTMRLHDELRKLPSASYSNLGWRSQRADDLDHAANGLPGGAAVSATVLLELLIPQGLSPSFCSAVVSLQYSLIMQCKVKGVQVDNFGLEIPVQIFYSHPKSRQNVDSATPGSPAVASFMEGSPFLQFADRPGVGLAPAGLSRQQEDRLLPPEYGP